MPPLYHFSHSLHKLSLEPALAESAVVHPDHAEQLNAVLRSFISYWCDQYPQRYIEKIYAQAATEKGDVFIQKLYFAPLYDLADDAYLLDLRRGASKIIKHYQAYIEQKQHSLQ